MIQVHPGLSRQIQEVEGSCLDGDMIEVESGFFGLQPDQALRQQSRDGNESKRECDLKGDKGSSQDAAPGCTRGARFQETAGIGGAGPPGGQSAEEESGQHGEEAGHDEDRRVRIDGHSNSLVRMPEEWEQIASSVPGGGCTESRSSEGDDEALCEVLTYQTPTRGADCGANGEFLPA